MRQRSVPRKYRQAGQKPQGSRASDRHAGHLDQHQRDQQHGLDAIAVATLERHQLGTGRRSARCEVRVSSVVLRNTRLALDKNSIPTYESDGGLSVKGLMQNQPLLLSSLLQHADRFHGATEIVSRTSEGPIHRYTYKDGARRARKLADALRRWGVGPSDRVATLAWNNYRHFEIEHGVTGLGAVWHAINPRLIPAQMSYIANHAEDKALFFESSFLPMVEKLAPEFTSVRLFVLMVDSMAMPETSIPNLLCYEDLLDS